MGAHVREELAEGVCRGRVAHPGEVQQHLRVRARIGGASRHVAPQRHVAPKAPGRAAALGEAPPKATGAAARYVPRNASRAAARRAHSS